MEVIMNPTTGGFTSREVQDMVDLRVDKAAEEIGYATGMLIMELLKTSPMLDNPAGHADVFHGLRRVRDAVTGRSGKSGGGQLHASGPLHVGPHLSQALTARAHTRVC